MPGIRELLAEVPSGATMPPLGWDSLTRWLRDRYVADKDEKERRKRAQRRHELYMSAGDVDMAQFVMDVFKDPTVRNKRKEWVSKAKFNNVIRRVVNELSTVYSEPATRTVANDSNDRYQELQRKCRQNEVMRRANRWLNLHRNILVGFRVRDEGYRRVPVLDVLSPDCFYAIAHPLDPTRMVAVLVDVSPSGPNVTGRTPAFILVDDVSVTTLSADCVPVGEPEQPHGWERMPWLLCSLEPPAGKLMDNQTGEDLVAAHRAVWFENILLLKESKSATKLPVHIGDTTAALRQQAGDSEVPFEAPDGMVVQAIDLSMDLSLFRSTAQNVYETAAANYGIAPNLLSHQGVQSADARELMRAPLRELRKEQQGYLREVERELAEIQAMVCARDLPELSFDTDGWTIDFSNSETPLGAKESVELFEHKRRIGLTSTVRYKQEQNPDLTREMAIAEITQDVKDETARNIMMRPLQQIAGSMGAETEGSTAADAEDESDGDSTAPPMWVMRGAK